MPPILRGEILLDRMGSQARVNYEQLKKDAQELELQIKQLQVSIILKLYIHKFKPYSLNS